MDTVVHTKGHQWQNLPCQETAYFSFFLSFNMPFLCPSYELLCNHAGRSAAHADLGRQEDRGKLGGHERGLR